MKKLGKLCKCQSLTDIDRLTHCLIIHCGVCIHRRVNMTPLWMWAYDEGIFALWTLVPGLFLENIEGVFNSSVPDHTITHKKPYEVKIYIRIFYNKLNNAKKQKKTKT